MKITVDTNILVSASLWNGNEHKILNLVEQGKLKLILSSDILAEFEEVISRPLFHLTKEEVTKLINKIISISRLIKPRIKINICIDEDDNKILECAVEGKVDYIISGDRHLLLLKKFNDIKIIKSSELLKKLIG